MDPRFQEIPRERVADRIANELLRLITSGELAPGERLPGERQLADMMGGKIWVNSKPGKGSTFRFTGEFTLQTEVMENYFKAPPHLA